MIKNNVSHTRSSSVLSVYSSLVIKLLSPGNVCRRCSEWGRWRASPSVPGTWASMTDSSSGRSCPGSWWVSWAARWRSNTRFFPSVRCLLTTYVWFHLHSKWKEMNFCLVLFRHVFISICLLVSRITQKLVSQLPWRTFTERNSLHFQI